MSYRQIGIVVFLISLFSLGFSNTALSAAETYNLDTAHTYVMFRVKHLGVAYAYGRFNSPTGKFVFDESSPSNSSIEMQVKADDIDTKVDKRDNHLKSADFFNAAEHPAISFKSTSVKKNSDNTYEVSGDLTLLGKTRPITVKANDTGAGKDPWGKFRRGFETIFTIKRSEYGMTFMLNAVRDEVDITVSLQGIRE
jgi:polyisoprenoid-binding protein YceI